VYVCGGGGGGIHYLCVCMYHGCVYVCMSIYLLCVCMCVCLCVYACVCMCVCIYKRRLALNRQAAFKTDPKHVITLTKPLA
jgi:hypothetical protein